MPKCDDEDTLARVFAIRSKEDYGLLIHRLEGKMPAEHDALHQPRLFDEERKR